MAEISEKIDPEILLKKLSETDGLDKVKVLVDLAVAFKNINPEKVIKFGKQGLEMLKLTDDDGYWEQIEEYISERSDTQFTHGLCPECAKKYFPGEKDDSR